MQIHEELEINLRARFSLTVLVTNEEERALRIIGAVCEKTKPKRPCVYWDIADGSNVFAEEGNSARRTAPAERGQA